MKYLLIYLLVLATLTPQAQERELKSTITAVTVYSSGAQIERAGKIALDAGNTTLQLKGLSPHIKGNSIRVNATGSFTILSVNHRIDYFNEVANKKADSLKNELNSVDISIQRVQNRLAVLNEKHSLLNANKSLGGDNGVSVSALSQALQYFEKEMNDLLEERLTKELEKKELTQRKEQLQKEINQLNANRQLPTSIIEVRVSAEKVTNAAFTITYPVHSAGWYPKYDIKAKDVSSPLQLDYKAAIYQNTGVDWNNVQLSLSSADPNEGGIAPQLATWYLDFHRPIANRLQGRAAGIRTKSAVAVETLDEVVFSEDAEASTLSATAQQNQTSFSFKVDIPYSLKSNADELVVDLKQHDIPATYQYFAVPKLDTDAFLIARLTGWDQFNLLPGEANLFFENTYVGQTYIDPQAFSDTLEISLGRDKSISIEREKIDDFSKRRTIGSNQIDSRGFKIRLRNKKDQAIDLKISDQIPVSTQSAIAVSPVELSGGKMNQTTGEVIWVMNVPPNSQKELTLQYEVKYPKKERIILE